MLWQDKVPCAFGVYSFQWVHSVHFELAPDISPQKTLSCLLWCLLWGLYIGLPKPSLY